MSCGRRMEVEALLACVLLLEAFSKPDRAGMVGG